MTISIFATIQPSRTFQGAYEVVRYVEQHPTDLVCNRLVRDVIPCANLATARTIKRDVNAGTYGVAIEPINFPTETFNVSQEQTTGCLTGGLGYTPAITWILTGRVEQVTNWATAKSIARNNPVTPEATSNYHALCNVTA